MGVLIPWWERELERLGVKVETGVRVALAELDAAERAGVAVLLATGSRSGPRPYPSTVPVLTAAEFETAVLAAGSTAAALAGLPAGPVVVHDPIGDWTGVGVAEQVAAAGRPTTIVTGDQVAGTQLSITGDLAPANARLARAGVARELRSVLREVADGRAWLEHVWTGEPRDVPCALVIDCGHRLPEETLWRARPALPRAGDCVAPRTLYEAVREGRRAASRLAQAPER
jgi:2,4-dienoyl-CoA reductase (NADPH2)